MSDDETILSTPRYKAAVALKSAIDYLNYERPKGKMWCSTDAFEMRYDVTDVADNVDGVKAFFGQLLIVDVYKGRKVCLITSGHVALVDRVIQQELDMILDPNKD